ncbi:AbrB family transcriptional regulator [Rhodobacteraceae bacterium NNCM2]|nr:AbrB family transcriptional regulator [Coraliihabitans acroporae]
MSYWPGRHEFAATLYTIAIGAAGAGLAWALSFPVYLLTGPALVVSLAGLTGLRLAIAAPVRDASFIIIGIGIGTGFDARAADAMMRWPLAFAALAAMLFAILLACRGLLTRFFGFDPRSAVLASSPGHLSYIISLGLSMEADVSRIAVVQTLRVLILTICVPFVAMALGVDVDGAILPVGEPMHLAHLGFLVIASLIAGLVLQRLNVPAPLLIGAMVVSSLTQVTAVTPGVLSPAIGLPCYLVLGTMIGTRFSGISLTMLRQTLLAGLVITAVSVTLAAVVAVPVALILAMDMAHVYVSFAPGGIETMVAMGAMLGANPGFVAACHVARLMLLTVLVPLALPRRQKLSG